MLSLTCRWQKDLMHLRFHPVQSLVQPLFSCMLKIQVCLTLKQSLYIMLRYLSIFLYLRSGTYLCSSVIFGLHLKYDALLHLLLHTGYCVLLHSVLLSLTFLPLKKYFKQSVNILMIYTLSLLVKATYNKWKIYLYDIYFLCR